MRIKWIVNSILIMLLCIIAFLGLAHRDAAVAAEEGSDKIEGLLLDEFSANGSADFIVRFTEHADLSPAYSMGWNARGEFVYNTLRDTANNSQANAKAILDAQGLTYQTFIAGNDLYVWGGSQVSVKGLASLNELAALPEVSSIRATRTYYIDPVEVIKSLENISWAGDFLAKNVLTTVGDSTNATTDWGIIDTKANQFWTEFGSKGDGIVVANIDTGVQWNHPALINQFKCPGDPSNPACWADPSNICGSGGACDNNGHGTHTMGTMVAKDDPALPYIAGMAPNAKWIACKGCESNKCSDLALTTCADWILAPGGNPANRPNVVNNSWGDVGGDAWYMTYVNNWRAAGIFPAFSAGNSGPNCNTLGSPGDYQVSFASAAHASNRTIASFSSRSPGLFGHDPYTKPNISAPGQSICSTVPTNNWSCGYSGTSMASPHAAGAVALLWSCNPALKGQIDATFQLLQNNTDAAPAGSCGAPPDGQGNYTYGYGYLDVLAAGKAICPIDAIKLDATLPTNDTTTITFTLRNVGTQPLEWRIAELPGVMNVNDLQVAIPPVDEVRQIALSVESKPASGNAMNAPSIPEGAVSLILDDGSVDSDVGVNTGGYDSQFIWFNLFTPAQADFPFALNQIQVFFDNLIGVDVGDAIDLVVYQDADSNPANGATLVATYHVTVQAVDGITWSVYNLPSPVLISGPGDVLIGAINRHAVSGVSPVSYPAAIDKTASQRRSWIGWWTADPPKPAILPPDNTFSIIDDIMTSGGNWMIRAIGNTTIDIPWLSESPTSGIVPAGESIVVAVAFDSTGLVPGIYRASLAIHTNNPDEGLITIPVRLSIPGCYLPIINK